MKAVLYHYIYKRIFKVIKIYQIVATATINFSLAGVQLQIKGDYYLRAACINFRLISHSAVHSDCTTKDWFVRFRYDRQEAATLLSNQAKVIFCHASAPNQ